MTLAWAEAAARLFEPVEPKWESPLDLAQAVDPRVKRSADLDLINNKLVKAFKTPGSRLIVSMAPQRGKSELCSHWFPTWALHQRPEMRITLASYQANIARTFGRKVRDEFINHADELGQTVRTDLSAQNEWQLEGTDGGMYTTGVGGSLTSKPSDLMIIDDPTRGLQEASSPTYQERTYEWYTGTALSRLATGENEASIVMVLTRWSDQDLAGQVMAAEPGEWDFVRIPAQADHRPELGETDPLGREPDEWLQDVRGTTAAQWERRKKASGPFTWAALYQGRPSPAEGGIFPRDWATYAEPMWTERKDGARIVPGMERDEYELAASWDLTFSDGKKADYVVGQVWLRIGNTAYLLDQVRERMNFNRTCEAMLAMSARWPQCVQVFVENKANGPAVINALQQQVLGLIPIEPEGSKSARASAVSPLAFSKNIVLPSSKLLPNVEELREELVNFPSTNDDTVDALSQAVNRLLLMPLLRPDETYIEPDEFMLQDERGWSLSPY